ncbi:MAG: DUF58 domain-containing protein [Bryobacteraceae bacterium]|nr:DUF58 domain-containing protein [Bryobacteraceae bacterium]
MPASQSAPLIDRQLLERLERLTIYWQKSFRGLVGGHNTSHFAGAGVEFYDHRRFHQGDDLRAVNWRAYLRLEKLFLKMFQAEPRAPIRLLLDASASMTAGSGEGEVTKFDYARQLAAALTYVGLVRHDSILIQPFHETLDETCLASGGRHRFGPVTDFLLQLQPRGRSAFMETSRQFLARYTGAGLLIVISDFFDDADVLRPLQYLSDFGHELMLIQLWSPSEREPAAAGDVHLEDAETGAPLDLSLDAGARRSYTEAFDRYAGTLENLALRTGGRYCGFPTSLTLDDAMLRALEPAGPESLRGGAAAGGR